MFKINQPQKANVRVGQKVVVPAYSQAVFKVESKSIGLYGEVLYVLKSVVDNIKLQANEKSLQKA